MATTNQSLLPPHKPPPPVHRPPLVQRFAVSARQRAVTFAIPKWSAALPTFSGFVSLSLLPLALLHATKTRCALARRQSSVFATCENARLKDSHFVRTILVARDSFRPYSILMTNTNNGKAMWKFQHDSGSISDGYATDARGLRLRKDCGYTHVKMEGTVDGGWLQIDVAIRKVEMRERLDSLVAA